MLQQFIIFLKEQTHVHPAYHFAVAVSGGIDSVVLCELCRKAHLTFSIVHCNFHLRGEESDRDEAFVKALGEKYSVQVFVKHFDTERYAGEKKLTVQEAARNLRYQWFEELSLEQKFSYTLLGHHANDNIETVLMNFFRGTGLHGVTGMSIVTPDNICLRPLLNYTRKEIKTFAQENQLQWVEDSSNASNKYTRNFLRNELLPALQKIYPQVEKNLLDNIERFQKIERLYAKLVSDYKQKICQSNESSGIKIPVKLLQQQQHNSLIYEIIKDYHFSEKQVPEVIKLLTSESGHYIENELYRIIKHRNWLIIAHTKAQFGVIPIHQRDKRIFFEYDKRIEIEWIGIKNFHLKTTNNIAQIDANGLEWPLLLRKWKEGDYFYPLGLRKKKKLARFFIDQKLSKVDKENVWVMESAQRIVWVVGYRIDDRFKIIPHTKEVVQFTFVD